MWIVPLIALTMLDFVKRMITIKGERVLSERFGYLNYLVSSLAIARFIYSIPYILVWTDRVALHISDGTSYYKPLYESSLPFLFVDFFCVSLIFMAGLVVFIYLKKKLISMLSIVIFVLVTSTFFIQNVIITDLLSISQLFLLFQVLPLETLLCDIEDSREKLDRFFSYNFLFFDDD